MSEKRFVKAEASIENIKRSRFNSLSHSHKTTFNVGDLVPVMVQEVLPGDEYDINVNFMARLQTPLVPAMDDMYIQYYAFFVPNRLTWSNWKYFMGESKGAYYDNTVYRIPSYNPGTPSTSGVQKNSLMDYFGIPIDTVFAEKNINVLPFRAYTKIFNEWFRDENLQDPILEYTSDNVTVTEVDRYYKSNNSLGLQKANKMHDYFTSALPSPQKGPTVFLPFGDINLPVVSQSNIHGENQSTNVQILNSAGELHQGPAQLGASPLGEGILQNGAMTQSELFNFGNLYAVDSEYGSFGAPTINAMRLAFQIQRIYEKDARSGTRYVELLRSHFGVISPDSRQQRPEYLGGGSEVVGMYQQVATTAGTNANETNMLGSTGAWSRTNHTGRNIKYAATEHGYILILATCRYRHTYSQGIPRMFTRQDRFDFYDPTLAHLGEQPVFTKELYANVGNDHVFGYQEAWADYRYNHNRASGNMRVFDGSLGSIWTYQDNYTTIPTLSASWIKENKNNVERTLSLGSDVVENIFADFYFKITATRPMPLYSVPGLIDHF